MAREFYAASGTDIDIIRLNGSIELAPILGLSDVIVDLVETGTTLRENNLQIIDCPIVREESGLALSSRNERLSKQEKETSLAISKTLFASLEWAKETGATVAHVQQRVIDTINAVEGLEVEYYEIVDQSTLLPTDTFNHAIGCVTVYCGPVRLIDNIKYN